MPMSNRNKLPDTALMPNYAQCHVPGPLFFNASWRKTADLWLRFQTRVCSLYFLATSRLSFRVFVATALQRFHFCQ